MRKKKHICHFKFLKDQGPIYMYSSFMYLKLLYHMCININALVFEKNNVVVLYD